ncbi:MAG: [protein-PII] uridylyltransferase [Actinomycetia bacterium]|nr:[protein-PII] uridylyltransferase [Actinomycetes bacterium]
MSLPSEVTRAGSPGRGAHLGREGLIGVHSIAGSEALSVPGAGARRRVAISSYLSGWLTAHWTEATDGSDTTGSALVALGSVGRGDAGPHSDLDIVLLHDPRARISADIDKVADRLLYPLWDSGIRIDHSVRTFAQCRTVASGDLTAAIGLLDLAHVAGDPELSSAVRSAVHHDWRKAARLRLPTLIESLQARHARYDDLAQSLEPDIKESRGGLRDVIVLRALVTAWLADHPHGRLDDATDFLLDVRDAIHLVTQRHRSLLTRDIQADVATMLGLAHPDDLLAQVSAAARSIAYGLDGTLRKASQAQRARTLRVGPRRPRLTPLGYGFYESDGEVVIGSRGVPQTSTTALRCAVIAGRAGLPISPATLSSIAAAPHGPEAPWPAEARSLFTDVLATGQGLLAAWEGLDHAGLVETWLPDWARVRGRPQRSPIHRHTVDRHLLETVVEACALMSAIARPDLLLMAALLHDIGKLPGVEDHSAAGVPIATDILTRMGFADRERDLVAVAVGEHLSLMDLATRHDPHDPQTIEQAYAVVRGDRDLAEILIALSEADARAAGPLSWSRQRESLFRTLVEGLHARLGPGPPTSVSRLSQANAAHVPVDDAARASVLAGKPVIVVEPEEDGYRIDVIEADRACLFADCASALQSSGLTVSGAHVRTIDGLAVNSWSVQSPAGAPDLDRVRRALERLAVGAAPIRSAARRSGAGVSSIPCVLPYPDPARAGIILDVRCADRPGLLADLGYAISRTGFEIRTAEVATYAGQARDVLLVRPTAGSATSAGVEAMLGAVRAACG